MTDKLALFMERLPELTISFAGKLLIALLIFFIGRWIAKGIAGLLKKLLGKGKMDGNVVQFLGNLAYGI
ncbi:MAG: hypothetical protein M0Q19_05340, partial [Candidatus Cloacimonetes bacterium]|nr:hypothetical protein [Candidatus Cloacimonadota bacterium]